MKTKAGTLDLRDLALFLDVVDTGSITAGAERRGLSLSAASVRVGALERRFGQRLLHRGGRGVTPTAAGRELVAKGRGLLGCARDLESSMAVHARDLRSRVRLATNGSATDALTEFLASALSRLPRVAVTLTETSSETALAHVRDGRADLAVVSSDPSPAGRRTYCLWDDHLVVVGPVRPGPARSVSLRELLDVPLIGLTEGHPLQDLVDRRVAELDGRPAYRVRLPSLSAVCAVAGTGAGWAVVPTGSVRRHGVNPAAVYPLEEPWAERHASLVVGDLGDLGDLDGQDTGVAAFVDLLLDHRVAVDAADA
ncbi:LysR family transcriptional regulator [Nocardiopsis sp. MG754419]|uniref:LysR family transcriptional regulator n=1 Tax=Nocardiopsis sp. MG754419 TaxID=2259865 RepID=UPI001BA639EC|nr:LysR family transcriptional regulator [Nocardiopsis sp. MG754419]